MSEILFILTVIYAAYVIYQIVDDGEHSIGKKIDGGNLFKPPGNMTAKIETVAPVTEQSPPKKNQSSKPKTKTNPKTKKQAAPKIELRTVLMKNPATGEEAKVATNYRMVKRWVKEALVEEGLLEKIYKTNEMDDDAKAEVAKALSIIKAMDKYKV